MEHRHLTEKELMELCQVDEKGLLFVSPEILDWQPLTERKIRLVIDLDADVDIGVPTLPNNLMYVYFPFNDKELPDLVKLHALGRLAADMVRHERAVLIHCAMGFNRSPLVAGVALTYLGMTGAEAVQLLRTKRIGALFNQVFADYLTGLSAPPDLTIPG